jgi:hypothetical protein
MALRRVLAVVCLAIAAAAVAAPLEAAASAPGLSGTFSTTLSGERVALLNGHWQLRLLPGSHYTVLREGKVMVRGVGARTPTRISFEDRSGPAACLGEGGSAVYRWKLSGRRLTLTPLSEHCAGRRAVLGSHPLLRR